MLALTDKLPNSPFSLIKLNFKKPSHSCLKSFWSQLTNQSKLKLWNQQSTTMPQIWIHTRTLFKWFTTLLSEIIIWVNQALVSEKILTQSLLIKLSNSTTNSLSEKTSLFQVLEKSIQLNSTNLLTNTSVASDLQLKDKFQTKNNHTSPHLWCSKEMIKFQTLQLVLLS